MTTPNPLSERQLKKHAREAWASAYKSDKRGNFGVGHVARANWYAGYAAALDWAVQMVRGKKRNVRRRLRADAKKLVAHYNKLED